MQAIIENPNDLLSKNRIRRAYRHHHKTFSDILEDKVTQSESRMRYSVYKVLSTLDLCGKINTSKIQEVSGLNWTSITKTTDLLRQKRIIELEQHHDKQNNEKMYSIKRNRAVIYLDHIFHHRMQLKEWKKSAKYNKKYGKLMEDFPKNFLSWWIFFGPRMQKKLRIETKNCFIKALPLDKIIMIYSYYRDGNYCNYCQDSYSKKLIVQKLQFFVLSDMIRKKDFVVCEICDREQQYDDSPPGFKGRIGTKFKLPKMDETDTD